jgi:hypothetical protein
LPWPWGAITQPISGTPSKDGSITRLKSAKPISPMKRPLSFSVTTQ